MKISYKFKVKPKKLAMIYWLLALFTFKNINIYCLPYGLSNGLKLLHTLRCSIHSYIHTHCHKHKYKVLSKMGMPHKCYVTRLKLCKYMKIFTNLWNFVVRVFFLFLSSFFRSSFHLVFIAAAFNFNVPPNVVKWNQAFALTNKAI